MQAHKHTSIPMPVSMPPVSSWVSANKPHIPAALVSAMEGLCWGHQLETAELHSGKVGRSYSALARAVHKQRQETEAMKEQLVSSSWEVLNWYWKGSNPRSKGSKNSNLHSWEKSQAMGAKRERTEISVLEKHIACSVKGSTAEFCNARWSTSVLWHWLMCLLVSLTVSPTARVFSWKKQSSKPVDAQKVLELLSLA